MMKTIITTICGISHLYHCTVLLNSMGLLIRSKDINVNKVYSIKNCKEFVILPSFTTVPLMVAENMTFLGEKRMLLFTAMIARESTFSCIGSPDPSSSHRAM